MQPRREVHLDQNQLLYTKDRMEKSTYIKATAPLRGLPKHVFCQNSFVRNCEVAGGAMSLEYQYEVAFAEAFSLLQ